MRGLQRHGLVFWAKPLTCPSGILSHPGRGEAVHRSRSVPDHEDRFGHFTRTLIGPPKE